MKRMLYCYSIVLLLLCAIPVLAQALTPPTLAAALASASAPTNGVTLAIGAEQVPGTVDTPALEPHASVTQVGEAYGRMVRRFGNVSAVAAPTMVVFNNHPGQPDIYDGMRTEEIAKLLAASLNKSQWQMLTREEGIGLSDLADDDQRQMFMALFPDGKLKIRARGNLPKEAQDVSSERIIQITISKVRPI